MELYGFTPPAGFRQTFHAASDDTGNSTEEKYPEPGTEEPFYNFTSNGRWITFDGPFLLFDYAVTSVTELENLLGQTVIVDDSNTEIQWGGNWEEKKNYTVNMSIDFSGGMPGVVPGTTSGWSVEVHARPHGNGTHASDKVGDYFIFQFQGSSILVGGIAPMNRTDPSQTSIPVGDFHLKLNFTLDGHSQVVVFTEDALSQKAGTPHFPYFRNDSLVEGNHTLIMTVDDATGNTSVIIDYLTYKPSFPTLKDKPTFPPIVFNDNSTSSPDPPPGSNTGTIAGSVVGGVAFLGLLVLGIWLLYKRKRQVRQFDKRESMNISAMSDLVVEPFLFQNPTNPLPRKDTPSIPQVQSSTSAASWAPSPPQQAELRRQREELEETIQNLESQSGDTRTSDQNLVMQDQMREMLARMDVLTREMGRYVVPPEYDSV
ncbi:hypothetical protein K435DRAFT_879433 [Dendrothele bispora CBS 962.96]|uniref:Epidermal growth factor receptor-like transmembrane-juxtamembrane segment domain-containing protein n=1 Tax=Dendrothele bispora (strain CBS 962.96) TaxID=1314807 RepID=A0A4S8KL98_DENBC|nr:hypothetical protein K435DRAFT_879433 [Dendrothele bispora CBS 962.96]